MKRPIRKTLFAMALAVAALGAIAATATALPRIAVPSKVSIKSRELHFSGQVTTPAYESCEQQRKVVLYKVVGDGPDESVGRATTSDNGSWSITVSGWAGVSLASFYAKVTKSSQGTAGPIYVCNAAKSKTIKPTS